LLACPVYTLVKIFCDELNPKNQALGLVIIVNIPEITTKAIQDIRSDTPVPPVNYLFNHSLQIPFRICLGDLVDRQPVSNKLDSFHTSHYSGHLRKQTMCGVYIDKFVSIDNKPMRVTYATN
jgi:protein tyrosine/serine phosphatase